MHESVGEIDLIPREGAEPSDAQAMPEGNQDRGRVIAAPSLLAATIRCSNCGGVAEALSHLEELVAFCGEPFSVGFSWGLDPQLSHQSTFYGTVFDAGWETAVIEVA